MDLEFPFLKGPKIEKNGDLLFFEAITCFEDGANLKEVWERFRESAGKGHEESLWIVSIIDIFSEDEYSYGYIQELFAKTNCPMGWYWAGQFSFNEGEEWYYFKKSSDSGYSWAMAKYGNKLLLQPRYANDENHNVAIELLLKAVSRNNPQAMHILGDYYFGNSEKARSYYLAAARLGFKPSMDFISKIYYFFYFASYTEETKSCWVDNQIEAIRWAAKGGSNILYSIFRNWYALLNSPKKGLTLSTSSNARDGAHLPFGFTNLVTNLESSTTNIITFELGRALYFYFYIYRDSSIQLTLQHQLFMKKCLKYYHESLNLQQKSIFTFLWCWRMILGKYGGAREVVNIIAQMLWTNRDLYPCLDFMQF